MTSPLMKICLLFAFIFLLGLPFINNSAQLFAEPGPLVNEGLVSDAEAIIQTFNIRDGDGGDKKSSYVDVQVKIRTAGTYIVRAGFTKGGRWHNGGVLGTKFWDQREVRGDAGDSIKVSIFLNKKPVFIESSDVRIYRR